MASQLNENVTVAAQVSEVAPVTVAAENHVAVDDQATETSAEPSEQTKKSDVFD
ncbi:hypothetical protein CMUS01_12155, partial [Colletotrichum musicola]